MHRFTGRAALFLATLLASACATAPTDRDQEFRSRNLLTAEQIADVRARDAYEAVERLKSQWLRPRGRSQMPAAAGVPQFEENLVMVYLDDQRLGGVENLRRIEIAVIEYIRYLPPAEAAARWGFNNGGGAIFVSTQPLDR